MATPSRLIVTEPCVLLHTFGSIEVSLVFVCGQSVSEFLWDRLRASIKFPVMPKRAQYARFSEEAGKLHWCPSAGILAAIGTIIASLTKTTMNEMKYELFTVVLVKFAGVDIHVHTDDRSCWWRGMEAEQPTMEPHVRSAV